MGETVRATLSHAEATLEWVEPCGRLLAAPGEGAMERMADNWGDWLLDDWERAEKRSLVPRLSRRQRRILRYQWRIGQAVKLGLLLLALLLGFSLLVPDREMLRRALLLWCVGEEALLLAHIALGVRYGVSYGWALHHTRPLLLCGLSANHDLKVKGFLAALVAVLLLQALLATLR